MSALPVGCSLEEVVLSLLYIHVSISLKCV